MLLVFADTGNPRRWVVADTSGRRIQDLPFPPSQVVPGWLRGSTLVVRESGVMEQVKSFSLADGRSRTLYETTDILTEPTWGRATVRRSAQSYDPSSGKLELRIFDAAGALRKTLALSHLTASESVWSPVSRWIAYAGFVAAQDRRLRLVDVASGRGTDLLNVTRAASISFSWLPSRAILVSDISQVGSSR